MRLGQNGTNNVKLDGMYFSMIDSDANGELYRFYNEEQMALVYKGSKKCKLVHTIISIISDSNISDRAF